MMKNTSATLGVLLSVNLMAGQFAAATSVTYPIIDGGNAHRSVEAFNCGTDTGGLAIICPGYVPMDITGAPFGVLANPFYMAPVQDVRPNAGSITTQDAGSSIASGQNSVSIVTGSPTANSVFAQAINGQAIARVQLSGTWTGTLAFEGSVDGGTTWVAQPARVTGTSYTGSSATLNGMFLIDTSGLTNIRARATAAMTGSAAVTFTFANNAGVVQVINPVRLFDQASGQQATIDGSGNLNTHCQTGCASPSDTTVSLSGMTAANAATAITLAGTNSVAVLLSGTWVGTVTPEVSADGGTTWVATQFWNANTNTEVATVTSNGTYDILGTGGKSQARVRLSAYTSGTVTGNLKATSQAPSAHIIANTNPNGPAAASASSPVTPSNQPVGAANWVATQVSVTSSATPLLAARTGVAGSGRVSATICNTTTTALWLGGSGVTAGSGALLAGIVGACRTINAQTAIYGISGGSSATVTVDETY